MGPGRAPSEPSAEPIASLYQALLHPRGAVLAGESPTGTREVSARVTGLACLDDSSQNDVGTRWTGPAGSDPAHDASPSAGPVDDTGLFELAWADSQGGVAYARWIWLWRHLDDGDVVVPDLEFRWRGGAEARTARIIVTSGGCSAEVFVPTVAGEGVRSSTHGLRAEGRSSTGDVGFYADLTVTVGSG